MTNWFATAQKAEAAFAALQARSRSVEPSVSERTLATETGGYTTNAGDSTVANEIVLAEKAAEGKVKKKGKPKMTAKERKERNVRLFCPGDVLY